MNVDKIDRGEVTRSGKHFTWINRIHLWCNSCQESKVFRRAGHSMGKNLVIICDKCGDSVRLERDYVKDTCKDVAPVVNSGPGQPYYEEDDVFPWDLVENPFIW